ncbi:NAD(P)H-binding protein [Nocardia rhizosphaerihabitans]|uniref:NmrA family transcriptional regulator n=1 Tax=Nocardia rhizosphaerihabitans TaxID=1691570 RepID=A0ABQ2L379_9NOCA|nr:NAD(P)H-binding protein [Nocardia rhizosphaerihabitans]GGO00966.1 NmrA family transcriptional regulator [Nocardia rhizosphaerihabitans]
MPERDPILITGAAGEIGAVSRTMVEMLLEQGYPVRAFVRRDDERAQSLRQAGAEIFVGDLLNIADVTAALKGCRRIYFSMSLSPYYTDAVALMAAAARAKGDIEVFVNISEYEQSFMTLEKMTAPEEERRAWLGGLIADWSPQQRAHWVAEQMLDWSGVPTVNVRAAMFVENPILTWFALASLGNGELRLPFGDQPLAPIAGYDVAELCAKILVDPAPHLSKSYDLTGPELKDMHGYAQDYEAVLGRPVAYVPEDVETWNKTYVDSALSELPHTAEHLKTLTRLMSGGGYGGITDQLETLLGRPPKTVRWALENNPRLRTMIAN